MPADPARYRYGVVLSLTLALLVFVILAPASDWSRAVGLVLETTALAVAVGTSRARSAVRRSRAATIVTLGAILVVGVATGVIPEWASMLLSGALAIAIPASLMRGLVRLIRESGATLQAIAGALTIYLLIGLVFTWVIGFVTHVQDAAYFADGTDGTTSDRAYFSLTVLTTTGFGDFTAAQPLGRALAVVEMLIGQLYLVTVIGVLVGSLSQRRSA